MLGCIRYPWVHPVPVHYDPLFHQMLLEVTLHAADLSGPVRPWEVSSVWAAKVSEEFDR